MTDPVENVTTWVYDALNRASEERNHLYDSRYFVYDAASNLIQKTDRNERVTVYEHDNLHRLVAEEWWGGTRPSIGVTTSTEGTATDEVQRVGFYDGTPFVSGTFTLTFDSQTTGSIAWDADAATVRAALEALSNIADGDVEVVKSQEYSTSQEWQITFVGALRGSDVAQITIDAAAVDNGVGPPTGTETTDATGSSTDEVQVVTLSDATGGTFTLSFGGAPTDPLDWDASTGDVDSALEALSGAGTVSVSGSSGGPYTITFTGDYGGQDIAPLVYRANDLANADLLRTIAYTFNAGGELLEVSDPDANYEYLYDGLGRVTNFVQNLAGFSDEIEFVSQYNAASRREHLQAILDGDEDFQNSYTYDNLHRLSLMVQESGSDNVVAPKRFEFAYNSLGQFERIDRYASTDQSEFVASSHYSYDDLNRLLKLVHAETTTAPTSGWGSDPLAGYEYEYDEASRIAAIDSMLDGLSEFEHDDTYQLLAADHASMTDEVYEYDANGNRIMSGYDVDPNNQLYSDGTYNYTYDDEGNRETRTRISDGYVTRYEWDFRNRLTMVTEEDDSNNALQVTILVYDAFNQWISRSFDDDGAGGNPFTDTYFVYESGQVVLEFDGNSDSDLTHRYAWSHLVDQSLADEGVSSLGSAGQTLWTFGDHLGTIRDLVTYNSTSNIATVANHREWDSYGKLTDQSSVIIVSTIGFTGKMWDITTGLQNNLNRWYDPAVGRWMSEDPLGFKSRTSNIAGYVNNTPLTATDPTGLIYYEAIDDIANRLDSEDPVTRGGAYSQLVREMVTREDVELVSAYLELHWNRLGPQQQSSIGEAISLWIRRNGIHPGSTVIVDRGEVLSRVADVVRELTFTIRAGFFATFNTSKANEIARACESPVFPTNLIEDKRGPDLAPKKGFVGDDGVMREDLSKYLKSYGGNEGTPITVNWTITPTKGGWNVAITYGPLSPTTFIYFVPDR